MFFSFNLHGLFESHPKRRTAVVLFNRLLMDDEVSTFFKGISPKVNVTARLKFELATYDIIAQNVSHYATETLP